jgi:hypothetical protein
MNSKNHKTQFQPQKQTPHLLMNSEGKSMHVLRLHNAVYIKL